VLQVLHELQIGGTSYNPATCMPPSHPLAALKAKAAPIVVSLCLASLARPAHAAAPETIEIGQGKTALKAVLMRPDGPGPFPAVVALHSCAGLYNRKGTVSLRYLDWAQHLTKAGFVVLYPDSYGSRGLGSQCAARNGPVRPDHERVADANAARDWLQQQSYVQPDKVSLIGWSTGGASVLWAVRRYAGPKDGARDFRAAVAFYPSCARLDNAAWSARVPTLVLIGASDDWASAKACEAMIAGARGRSARVSIMVYPGAYHDFDHPSRPVQTRNDYALSVDHSGTIHLGTDAGARSDALRRVPLWLAQ
jgi:dienelactone hydrolase